MARYAYLVFTETADEDQEAAYNEWYERIHIPDVLAVDGMKSWRRYRLANQQGSVYSQLGSGQRYMVMFDVETDDLSALDAELTARAIDGRLRPSPTIQTDPVPVGVHFEVLE